MKKNIDYFKNEYYKNLAKKISNNHNKSDNQDKNAKRMEIIEVPVNEAKIATISKEKTIKRSLDYKRLRKAASIAMAAILALGVADNTKRFENMEQEQHDIDTKVAMEAEVYENDIIRDGKNKLPTCGKEEREKFAEFYNAVTSLEDLNKVNYITYERELEKQRLGLIVSEYVVSGELKDMGEKVIESKLKQAFNNGEYLKQEYTLKNNFAYTEDGFILNEVEYGREKLGTYTVKGLEDFLDVVYCMKNYKNSYDGLQEKNGSNGSEIIEFGCRMGKDLWYVINTNYTMTKDGELERSGVKDKLEEQSAIIDPQKSLDDDFCLE